MTLPKEERRAQQKQDKNIGIHMKQFWMKMERKPVNLSVFIALKYLVPIQT